MLLGLSDCQLHIHNNGQAQTNLANSQMQVVIGHSGHALNSEHVLRVLATNNCSNAELFSDLMKFTVVNESLSKQSRNVLFQTKINWINNIFIKSLIINTGPF